MEVYNHALIPNPFGLLNTGVICYFNSFLQTLSGCSAFTSMVLKNSEYMSKTRTGMAMYQFVEQYLSDDKSLISNSTINILKALIVDLRERRPSIQFGRGQESAHEAFILLLDMMEPIENIDGSQSEIPSIISSINSPITKLFLHKCEWNTCCLKCSNTISKKIDYGVIFDMHHIDSQENINYVKSSLGVDSDMNSPQAFSKLIKQHISPLDGFTCPQCNTDDQIYRIYNLRRIPEIVFCSFNIYYQQGRRIRYFPPHLEFDAPIDKKMNFKLIGQIEHSGSLGGGHYWAKGLRSDNIVYDLNDMNVSPSIFQSTPYTYMIIYHIF
jgi:ubiquitin C-terminal hydrolase